MADVVERLLFGGGGEVGDPARRGVGRRAAEFVEGDLLARDRLDDVRAGDEHVARVADHEGEVRQRGGVHRAARAGAHDGRNLRDDARRLGVSAEDFAEAAERLDALLNPRAGGVVEADDGRADLHRLVHHLTDLLGEHLTERAAENGEVVGEDEDGSTVDLAVAGDDAVSRDFVSAMPKFVERCSRSGRTRRRCRRRGSSRCARAR